MLYYLETDDSPFSDEIPLIYCPTTHLIAQFIPKIEDTPALAIYHTDQEQATITEMAQQFASAFTQGVVPDNLVIRHLPLSQLPQKTYLTQIIEDPNIPVERSAALNPLIINTGILTTYTAEDTTYLMHKALTRCLSHIMQKTELRGESLHAKLPTHNTGTMAPTFTVPNVIPTAHLAIMLNQEKQFLAEIGIITIPQTQPK